MIDKDSPEYLAGLAAGRLSFRLSVFAGFVGENHCVIKNMDLAAVALLGSCGAIELGLYRLVVLDLMPEVQTYPDVDEDL